MLVPKENPQELAAAIQQLINNEAKMAAMGLMAMEQVTQFSEEAVYQQWQHLVLTL
jgi:glycosyltransferase involved in cell wall biosynthesis